MGDLLPLSSNSGDPQNTRVTVCSHEIPDYSRADTRNLDQVAYIKRKAVTMVKLGTDTRAS